MTVLLSIKPEYVERIFAGSKRYEYRRRLPLQRPSKIVIYATSPVSQIVGEFTVTEVIEDSPERLWQRTRRHGGVKAQFFRAYFSGRATAYAYKVGEMRKYDQPVEPKEALENFSAPQSFRYLR
jgi:predicted transcriptional regulator